MSLRPLHVVPHSHFRLLGAVYSTYPCRWGTLLRPGVEGANRSAFKGPIPRHIGVWFTQAHTVVVLPLRGSFEGYLPSLRSGLTSQSGARAGSSLRSI